MTKVAVGFPDENDDESGGKRRVRDDLFPELTAKHKEQRKLLARLVELVGQFEKETRQISTKEERGR
jgi:hypothetical protein